MPQQQLDLYFGLTVRIVRSVDPAGYKELVSTFKKWLREHPEMKKLEPELYVHRLEFDVIPSKFRVAGIENRVSSLTVSVAINQRQRRKGTMKFINHKVGHAIWPSVEQDLGDHENKYTLSGAQLTKTSHFEEYLATVVMGSVSRQDRKVKFKVSAQATPTYRTETLKNVSDPVVTKLDFMLNRAVQLTMHFDPA